MGNLEIYNFLCVRQSAAVKLFRAVPACCKGSMYYAHIFSNRIICILLFLLYLDFRYFPSKTFQYFFVKIVQKFWLNNTVYLCSKLTHFYVIILCIIYSSIGPKCRVGSTVAYNQCISLQQPNVYSAAAPSLVPPRNCFANRPAVRKASRGL